MNSNIKQLIYALKDNHFISIENVERGLKCGCVCPSCGKKLVAKKGEKTTHHFAHLASENCEYGYESSLHYAAKEILSKSKKLVIPAVYLEYSSSYKEKELLSDSLEINIDEVKLEMHIDNIIPDVVVYSGNKKLLIEIYVTHRVDDNKLQKIKELNISTIEIDLSNESKEITEDKLSDILLKNSDRKKWLYNSYANKCKLKMISHSDRIGVVEHGLALHTKNCPTSRRIWRGKSYANVIDDCIQCEFCIEIIRNNDNDYVTDSVICSGRERIKSINDIKEKQ